MNPLKWPQKIREHRDECEDEHAELCSWHISRMQFSLLWFQPGIWSVGIDRDQSGVYCIDAGKAFVAIALNQPKRAKRMKERAS